MDRGLSMVIPVYNEAPIVREAVEGCVDRMSKSFRDFELILVDDGSTDGTSGILQDLARRHHRVVLLDNLVNLNVGISIHRGFRAATREFVVHNGIDLPLAVEDLPALLGLMENSDILVLQRKRYAGATIWRKVTSAGHRSLLTLLFAGRTAGVRDFNFTQIYRRAIFEELRLRARSPSFTTPEMILEAVRTGLRVRRHVTEYRARTHGSGAFGKPHDILWTLYDMFRYRLG